MRVRIHGRLSGVGRSILPPVETSLKLVNVPGVVRGVQETTGQNVRSGNPLLAGRVEDDAVAAVAGTQLAFWPVAVALGLVSRRLKIVRRGLTFTFFCEHCRQAGSRGIRRGSGLIVAPWADATTGISSECLQSRRAWRNMPGGSGLQKKVVMFLGGSFCPRRVKSNGTCATRSYLISSLVRIRQGAFWPRRRGAPSIQTTPRLPITIAEQCKLSTSRSLFRLMS